jgi:hypothetical protein
MTATQVREKAQRILTDALGTVQVDGDGDFVIQEESAVTFVRVADWDDENTVVRVWSIMAVDVPLSDELFRWAATEGQDFLFGSCSVIEGDDGTGEVHFTHHLLGDFLDPDELILATAAVAATANGLDDLVKARFGGRLFTDD